MKFKALLFFVLVLVACSNSQTIKNDKSEFTSLEGKYFGQELPELTPLKFEPFGPKEAGEFIFSKDAKKCLFIKDFKLYFTEMINNQWLKPEMVNFTNFKNSGILGIGVSPNSDNLNFNSLKPVPSGNEKTRVPIWVVKIKTGIKWDNPSYLGFGGMFVSIANSGNLYFTTWKNGHAYLGRSVILNGKYQEPEVLPPPLQTEFEDMHPCISPDEKFVIFDSDNRPRENHSSLYISFFKDKTWTKSFHLGKYITQKNASLPRLSMDGKYLFFNDSGGDYYWISTKFIEGMIK